MRRTLVISKNRTLADSIQSSIGEVDQTDRVADLNEAYVRLKDRRYDIVFVEPTVLPVA